jgi:hypothetical protein
VVVRHQPPEPRLRGPVSGRICGNPRTSSTQPSPLPKGPAASSLLPLIKGSQFGICGASIPETTMRPNPMLLGPGRIVAPDKEAPSVFVGLAWSGWAAVQSGVVLLTACALNSVCSVA